MSSYDALDQDLALVLVRTSFGDLGGIFAALLA
jgi:hypothetical protein